MIKESWSENLTYEQRKELNELIQDIIRSLNDLADSYQRTADSFESEREQEN